MNTAKKEGLIKQGQSISRTAQAIANLNHQKDQAKARLKEEEEKVAPFLERYMESRRNLEDIMSSIIGEQGSGEYEGGKMQSLIETATRTAIDNLASYLSANNAILEINYEIKELDKKLSNSITQITSEYTKLSDQLPDLQEYDKCPNCGEEFEDLPLGAKLTCSKCEAEFVKDDKKSAPRMAEAGELAYP